MWPFTITPTITSVESVESLVNEDGNCLINLLQEKPLIAVTVNSLFNGYLWDRNEVSVVVCCPSYRESNKGVMRGGTNSKVSVILRCPLRESRLLSFVIHTTIFLARHRLFCCCCCCSSICWSSYHKGLLASSDYEGTVTLWDAFTGSKTRSFQVPRVSLI